ncbi:DUF2867 domain-containing protein [Kribbella solani]|uniref:DUF2867 domain-containing protein n=1 Tax=Kribbella solani TaxID=236067 RepID=A0A841DJW7_9ACTN|nr:DUF2867 domain-containing protein [Kribbella solani]MBB5977066.1 hypothetical protein [Kribbella solani]MDX2967944.1 DUF2867 domain-containing protein [Kribbella solani]MDX3002236.1 DUF2867 domain-containing protein [Kribbella solani]
MNLPKSAHTELPWRIHELTPDFRVYDVWALPTPGAADDFQLLVDLFAGGDTATNPSRIARLLFAIRWKLGEVLGWDEAGAGVNARVASLRHRLPPDLPAGGPEFTKLPFSSVYQTGNELAAEMANRTVHAVLHLSWVPDGAGGYRGQMGVLVRPNGWWGRVYMGLIGPFRHLFVYPPLMRGIEAEWRERLSA